MSDEPWPTMRIVVAPRSRARSPRRGELGLVLEQRAAARAAARGSPRGSRRPAPAATRRPQATTRASPPTKTRSISRLSSSTTQVGRRHPTSRRPASGRPSTRAGTGVAASSARPERHAELVQVPHRLDHRQDAAGEHAVVAADGAVADDELEPPSRYVAVALPAAATASVTSATRPAAAAPDEAHRVRGEVDPVDDDLDDRRPARGERRADDARVAVAERPHRVEEVRHGVDAAVEGGVRLLGGGVGVPAGDDDPAREQQLDQLVRARKLGRERHQPDRARLEQPLEQGRVRVAPSGQRECMPRRFGERNGPSRWTPRIRGPVRLERHLAERREQVAPRGR